MSEFRVINTQEEFDEAIGERLKRERETVRKEFEGYLSPEAVEKKYRGYLSLEEVEKKYEGYLSAEEASKKDALIQKYESDSVKTRIANELGIPYELAVRLNGTDEESIRKDAETLRGIIGTQRKPVAPLMKEGDQGDETDAALKTMLSEMKGE